jgi:hypothetical protein
MDGLASTMLKCIKQRAVIEFLTQENQIPIKIHRPLLAFYDEDTVDISTVHHWAIKSSDSGRNMVLNNQLQCGRPVSATHDVKRQNFHKLIQENQQKSTPRLSKDPKRAEKTNQLHLSGKKASTSST